MLKGSASQGGKEQEEKHNKASQGRKDRSTLRERQQENEEEKNTVSQTNLSVSPTSRNVCWLDHNRVRTGRNAHTDTYMHVHIHRALFGSLQSFIGIQAAPAERGTTEWALCCKRPSSRPPLFWISHAKILSSPRSPRLQRFSLFCESRIAQKHRRSSRRRAWFVV